MRHRYRKTRWTFRFVAQYHAQSSNFCWNCLSSSYIARVPKKGGQKCWDAVWACCYFHLLKHHPILNRKKQNPTCNPNLKNTCSTLHCLCINWWKIGHHNTRNLPNAVLTSDLFCCNFNIVLDTETNGKMHSLYPRLVNLLFKYESITALHVYTFVCACVYVCMWVYLCAEIVHLCVHLYMFGVCVCLCVLVCVCMCVCMCVCLRVCV